MTKWGYIIGAALIVIFLLLGVREMMDAQNPYISSVSALAASKGQQVQFIGSISKRHLAGSESDQYTLFEMKDESGARLRVRYAGVKPANFDTAQKAVVRGKFDSGIFDANQVLVKCPSKYQRR